MADWDALVDAALGLGLAPMGRGAAGVFDGQPVSLQLEIDARNGYQVVVSGRLDRPLDLGLEMRRRDVVVLDLGPGMTGDSDLDAEFLVRGDERARTTPLFSRALCAHLVAMHRGSQDFRVSDAGCTLYALGMYALEQPAHWVERSLRAVATTARLLDEARALVPPPLALRPHAEALGVFAKANALHCGNAPLLVEGRLDERLLTVGSTRTGKRRHALVARLSFATELGLGLQVRRERFLDALRTSLGAQDIAAGERAFDDHFLIQAEQARAERAGRLFDARVRTALLEIDRTVGAVKIDDHAITVGPIRAACPAEALVGMADSLGEIASKIERNRLLGTEDGGPYR